MTDVMTPEHVRERLANRIELATRAVRPLTSHFAHRGFTRARYVANGDVLLCDPREPAEASAERGRWASELWLLDRSFARPAQPLDEACFEGPAVSRRSLRIAWTRSEYPDRIVLGRSEIWTGEIAYPDGAAQLVNRRKLLDGFQSQRAQGSLGDFADARNLSHRERRKETGFAAWRNPHEAAWLGLVGSDFCGKPRRGESA